ncbi:hypothetical protein ACFOOM_23050 [Streptomyces echinoruber]|uniref:Uncharacterized protein n=1 Tax=Streptomyces echinoruber TaxID=68898 RepID=A0A918RB98_9ACTN|nr:hypothetical protein [Streptomyces echinoruber]GGZ92427.1 hypothetical protein GCM10010389_33850 [Streptomyces echinoruber]
MTTRSPHYGIRAVSWSAVQADRYPHHPDIAYWDGTEAAELNRLRGLVVVQAAETEAVLGMILSRLDPAARIDQPAGRLLQNIRQKIDGFCDTEWPPALDLIEAAVKRRNRVVHDSPTIGRVWRGYATGGGEWVHVLTTLGDDECDAGTLVGDLTLQQDATAAAVELLNCLTVPTQSP